MKTTRTFSIIVIAALLCGAFSHPAQAQNSVKETRSTGNKTESSGEMLFTNLLAQTRINRRAGFSLMPSKSTDASGSPFSITPAAAAPNLQVLGSGTVGRLTKWTGFTSSNSVIGNSTIFEDKDGLVGIGTDSPTSKLTVAGTITASGGTFGSLSIGSTTPTSGLSIVVSSSTPGIFVNNTGGGGGIVAQCGGVNPILPGPRGVVGFCDNGPGVRGQSTGNTGVLGASTSGFGVNGESTSGVGVRGVSSSNTGVFGISTNASAVVADSANGNGVESTTSSTNPTEAAVFATSSRFAGEGVAGIFRGTVEIQNNILQRGDLFVAGNLKVSGMKMFHIDHPLDPENKYLNHAAIESSEVLNVYSGNVITNENGDAFVTLPNWLEALNSDFRYQLTVVGQFAQAIIAEKIKGNRFAIKTNAANVEVSWQVTGVRSDPTARKYKFDIEEEKGERERGFYLNPDAFNQPEEKSIQWARDPEGMKQLKQRHIEAEQLRKQAKPNQR